MIFLFNASPKGKNSNTAYFLKLLKDRLGEPCSYAELSEMQDTVILGVKMIESDAVVIGMPVHLNAVPAMLLERMEALYAEFAGAFEDLPCYVIVNGGEYESEKLRILVKIMENWCGRMKMRYCGALAIGAGEMLGRLNQESGWEKINQKLFEGIGQLAGAVSQKCRIEEIYLKPPNGYTKFTYMLGARLRFHRMIKENAEANKLLRASEAAEAERMDDNIMIKKYVVKTYLTFWIMVLGICGSASMVFHAPPVVMRVLSNICAWSPTIVLLLAWNKLRPQQKRMDFIRAQFSGELKWYLLILLIAVIAGGSCLSVWLLSLWQGKAFVSYFTMGSYSLAASFFFSLLSGPTGEELGWRGYLREELDKRYTFAAAALIQGAVWTFWHTVLWFVDSDFSGIQLLPYILSNLVVMTSLVFVMNSVLQRYQNLIYSIVIHFTFNFIYCFLQVDIWFYAFFSIVYLLIGAGFYLWHHRDSNTERGYL